MNGVNFVVRTHPFVAAREAFIQLFHGGGGDETTEGSLYRAGPRVCSVWRR